MFRLLAIAFALSPATAVAQTVQPGDWKVTSRIIDLTVPGLPGFLVRMARGKSMTEHKRLSAGQGVEALLAPNPKARCRVDSQSVADGHYAQTLTCLRKEGEPGHIVRSGTYDATGFAGRATVAAITPKGPLSVVLDQRAARMGE